MYSSGNFPNITRKHYRQDCMISQHFIIGVGINCNSLNHITPQSIGTKSKEEVFGVAEVWYQFSKIVLIEFVQWSVIEFEHLLI